ncbi:hypothetical protein [Kribbella sindirgiensis]|uniref:Uncharacterized protein n=1 Tax=Kribbella sindirgiensis TaxID=1124744 RepID=A0A4R0I051_9ACTN|nr:hypothetical protein [Kribbella sindirgiensis]TCC19938.1 hypothetical protein E0H50_37545 [Kribbella sindirgiensis]
MRLIDTRDEFREFAREIRMRDDWHEPDEQGITATVEGRSFDNAGFWPAPELRDELHRERHVIFSRHEPTPENENNWVRLAAVNLATLCAWASEPDPEPSGMIIEETEEVVTLKVTRR